jgi:uncharacterized membrane-anchored protein
LNGSRQLLVSADYVNYLWYNTNTIKKYTESDNSKEVGLEVNAEKYMLHAGQNHDIKTSNRSFENVVQFKYLGLTVSNKSKFDS